MAKEAQNNKKSFKKVKQKKSILTFDENERREFLTGFSRRKEERRKTYFEKMKEKILNEQKKLRQEKRSIIKSFLAKNSIGDLLLQEKKVVAADTETHDLPEHTVTITQFSDGLTSGSDQYLGKNTTEDNDDADSNDDADDGVDDLQPLLKGRMSAVDKKRYRLQVIERQLRECSMKLHPVKAALLTKKLKKKKKRTQRSEKSAGTAKPDGMKIRSLQRSKNKGKSF